MRNEYSALIKPRSILAALAAAMLLGTTAASAAQCGDGPAGFGGWLESFKAQVAKKGVKPTAIASALAGVSYDPTVIRLDRSQHSFKLSFEQFYARRVDSALIGRGQALMLTHRATLDRMEKRFGVPRAIVIAIWGLETNYGRDAGSKYSIIRSLATLSYDCRRSEFFTGQLIDALRIVERGDLTPEQMRGGWAGEIGQTQFLPSPYVKYAVDFDGNGSKDLRHSVPDILASTANFLKGHGWQRGQPWQPGSANYRVLAEWNKAEVYQRTIAAMAAKIGGNS